MCCVCVHGIDHWYLMVLFCDLMVVSQFTCVRVCSVTTAQLMGSSYRTLGLRLLAVKYSLGSLFKVSE